MVRGVASQDRAMDRLIANLTVVKNELVDARKKLDEAYEHIKRAMPYADGATYSELEDIRIRLASLILDIDMLIERTR